MEHLVRSVSEMCDFKTQGGRVHVLSDMRTCYIYDVNRIDSQTLAFLQSRANVQVIGECTSLSGYVIKIQMKPNLITKVVAIMLISSVLCAINYYILYNQVISLR